MLFVVFGGLKEDVVVSSFIIGIDFILKKSHKVHIKAN